MDTILIIILNLFISVATYMGPRTPKAESVQPAKMEHAEESKSESVQPSSKEQTVEAKSGKNL